MDNSSHYDKVTDAWMKEVLKSGKALHIVTNPRTHQQYLIPRQINIMDYTIDDLYKLSGKGVSTAGRAGQFYTVSDIWKMIIKCARQT